MQAVLARGDRRLAPVLLSMKHLSPASFERALAEHGLVMDEFLGARAPGTPQPWEIVESGVTANYFLFEQRHAQRSETGLSCPPDASGCLTCGSCDTGWAYRANAGVPVKSKGPWRAEDWAYPVTTVPALVAVRAARQQGPDAADALDTALRRAYFVDQRCISLLPVIEDVARECAAVDADALVRALRSGAGLAAVFADLDVARGGEVRGSPHLWTSDGTFAVNPGVSDVDDFTEYDATWTDRLL